MQTKKQGVLQKLGKYVYVSFRLRSTLMTSRYLSFFVNIYMKLLVLLDVCVIMEFNLLM